MYDENWLVQLIKDETGYTDVSLAEDSVIDLTHEPLLTPKIYIGHLGIKLENPEDMHADGFKELENSEVLITAIQFLCLRSELPTVRTAIKAAWSNKSPFPNNSNFSSLFFMEASTVAKTSNKIWWQELIGLTMPRDR